MRGKGNYRSEVFGYAYDSYEMIAWAEKYAPQLAKKSRIDILDYMILLTPPPHIWSTVTHPVHKARCPCILIGSNKNEQLLARSEDEALIAQFMKALHKKKKPRWFVINKG